MRNFVTHYGLHGIMARGFLDVRGPRTCGQHQLQWPTQRQRLDTLLQGLGDGENLEMCLHAWR